MTKISNYISFFRFFFFFKNNSKSLACYFIYLFSPALFCFSVLTCFSFLVEKARILHRCPRGTSYRCCLGKSFLVRWQQHLLISSPSWSPWFSFFSLLPSGNLRVGKVTCFSQKPVLLGHQQGPGCRAGLPWAGGTRQAPSLCSEEPVSAEAAFESGPAANSRENLLHR